jgi:2-oxoglutarate dehydrogenase complex dehydrogenase (E1) component-like enzyme
LQDEAITMSLLGFESHAGSSCPTVSSHYCPLTCLTKSSSPDSPTQLHNRVINAPLLRYVDSLRIHGHRAARIDPLDLLQRDDVDALDPNRYGLIDTSRAYDVNGILWTKHVGEAPDEPELWTLREIVNHLRSVYVGRIAYEYMHSPSKTERLWFSHILEARGSDGSGGGGSRTPGVVQKKRIHRLLAQSETFDQFLQLKFPNLKRYGLEGGESMIPALDTLFSVAARGLSCFGIFIAVHFCPMKSDNSRRAAHRACHASSRPSELVDRPATNDPRLVIP